MKYNFAITKLVIHKNDNWNKNILRILKQGKTYVFNKYMDKDNPIENDFFLNGVTVSAIVGINGSGKSSLLDLTYRMFNNLGYCMKNSLKRSPTEPYLGFVPDIYTDLHFVEINNKTKEKKLGCLHNNGYIVAIEYAGKKFKFAPVREGQATQNIYVDYETLNNLTKKKLGSLSRYLFHTLVINYSLQAFLPDEYDKDGTIWPGKEGYELLHNNTWIDNIFHKNDGYQTPIVLNPYRDHGIIDMMNIDNLIDSHALSLLVFYKQRKRNNEFIPGYTTGNITYKKDNSNVIEKCRKYAKAIDNGSFMNIFCSSVKNQSHYASLIIQAYGFSTNKVNGITAELYLYLVYKTLNIASTYSDYDEFKVLGDMKNCTKGIGKIDFKNVKGKIIKLVTQILKDKSHITFKIRQVCYLLACLETVNKESDLGKLILSKGFSIEDYARLTMDAWENVAAEKKKYLLNCQALHLEKIIQTLPPPLFSVHIGLKNKNNEDVDFHHLSSGERQFIHTLSTMVYHINNIISIKSLTRLRYRKINIVLDEAELCSHPEMQRQYINTILNYLSVTGLTWNCAFHILVVTHSPFILSDIPQSNILYIENGIQIENTKIAVNPFGANVNDVLAQSFFLNKGFVGAFAKRKIESLVKYIKTDKQTTEHWDKNKAKNFINKIIGEPIVKSMLEGMLDEKNNYK